MQTKSWPALTACALLFMGGSMPAVAQIERISLANDSSSNQGFLK